MNELRKLWIEGPVGKLECALRIACPARACAVVAHPHPIYGGTLHNPVVFHADQELHRAGWTTLRFNFRGVGESEGSHGRHGEEVDDVSAAVAWLRGVAIGLPMVLVGYSFGAWCSVRHAAADRSVAAVVGIGLPVRVYDFGEMIAGLARPIAVVQGEDDEFGSPDEVQRILERATPAGRLYVVPRAPHAFPGRAVEAAALVVQAADGCLSAPARDTAGA